jgi:uncharacterized damage-inducible protein DinB
MMKHFFHYNWQVRDDWFDLLTTLSHDELYKKRIGGVGSIAYTLFHIIDVECAWICCDLQQKNISLIPFENMKTLQDIIDLSKLYRKEVQSFINEWNPESIDEHVEVIDDEGQKEVFTKSEILSHVIAHEIHHIGQLSIWAREIGLKPVSANLIRRNIF